LCASALLLPFSLRPQDAAALYSAAELALFDHGNQNTLLIPRDAGSTESDATAAAQALIHDGADIIIGPGAARRRAGRVRGGAASAHPGDRLLVGPQPWRANGVYLLSFQPEDEISRLVAFAATRNIHSIALLAPANEYGAAYRAIAGARKAQGRARASPSRKSNSITAPTRTPAPPPDASPPGSLRRRRKPSWSPTMARPLRAIGPALVRGGVDPAHVKLLGTSVWGGGEAQREPTFAGGWFVSTDPRRAHQFRSRLPGRLCARPDPARELGL